MHPAFWGVNGNNGGRFLSGECLAWPGGGWPRLQPGQALGLLLDVGAARLSVYVDGARVGEPLELRGYVGGGEELYWATVPCSKATVRVERKPVPETRAPEMLLASGGVSCSRFTHPHRGYCHCRFRLCFCGRCRGCLALLFVYIYVLSCNPLSLSPFYLPTHDQSSRVALNSPTCQDTEDTEPEPEPDAAAAAVVQVEPQPVASATAATPTATFLRHYPLLFQLVLCLCLCCIRTQRPSQPHPLAVLATHIYTL